MSKTNTPNELTLEQRMRVNIYIGGLFILAAALGTGAVATKTGFYHLLDFFTDRYSKEAIARKALFDPNAPYDLAGLVKIGPDATRGQTAMAILFYEQGIDTRNQNLERMHLDGKHLEALVFFAMEYQKQKAITGDKNRAWNATVVKVKSDKTYGSCVVDIEKWFQKAVVAPKQAFNLSGPATGTILTPQTVTVRHLTAG
jgi:hypothetical protein